MTHSKGILNKLALLLVAIAWGSTSVVVKGATDYLPSGTLLALRFTIASVILAIANYKKLKQLNRDYLKSGLIIGMCLFLAYFTQTLGIALGMPGKNHFLSSAYCVFVPFLGAIALKKKPDLFNIIAAIMCALGIILVLSSGGLSISAGDSISVISSIFWASQIVAITKYANDKDPVLITMLQFMVSAVCAWIFTLTMENVGSIQWNSSSIAGILYLGIICSGVCFLLQTVAQKTVEPTSVSILLSFENIFAIMFGVLFYNESLTTRSIIGFTLMFIAIIIAETKLSFIFSKKKTNYNYT